jgi:hypothetical protein
MRKDDRHRFQKPPPRQPTRFREREVARAVRAAERAGADRVEIDPASGRITVILSKQTEGAALDAWVKDHASKVARG